MSSHRASRTPREGVISLLFLLLTSAFLRQASTDENRSRDAVEANSANVRREWMHGVELDPGGRVRLHWSSTEDEIVFRVEAATLGYVGLGFSENGGMAGADLAIAWVDDGNGEVHLADYHATHNGVPVLDVKQDYILEAGFQNESHTVVRFRRAWVTCDPGGYDMTLGDDTVRLIWAFHEKDPVNNELIWHGNENRGVRSLHLRTPPSYIPKGKMPKNYWEVKMNNITIPDNMDTIYWCKIFRVPNLKKKHHIIGYTPILQSGNERYVHHMLLHECAINKHSFRSPESIYERYVEESGAACYSPTMPHDWETCITPVVAWGIGSQGEFMPEHVGLPFADEGSATYFMLEIHYDNPSFKKMKDNSGIRVHYTDQLRKYDGAILVNGITVTPLHLIPPHQEQYTNVGFCSSECTRKMFPEVGVKVISVLLHSHLAGRKMRLRHLRGGKELQRIVEDNKYDFNYQQTRSLAKEVEILPGDELVTECVYQTINRTEPTFGGYSTKEEMCLAFVTYYPRTALAACYSMAPVQFFFETVGVKEFYGTDMDTVEKLFLKLGDSGSSRESRSTPIPTTTTTVATSPVTSDIFEGGHIDDEVNQKAITDLKSRKGYSLEEGDGSSVSSHGIFEDLVIKRPAEFSNKSFTRHLHEVPWAEQLLTHRIEQSFRLGQHMTFCKMRDDQLALPAAIQNFPNVTDDNGSSWDESDNLNNERLCNGETVARGEMATDGDKMSGSSSQKRSFYHLQFLLSVLALYAMIH